MKDRTGGMKVEVTHSLRHEHRIIEQALRALDGICLRLGQGESVPAETVLSVWDFISTFAESFHRGKEERILFPALETVGLLYDRTSVEQAVHEHGVEQELVSNMRSAVDQYSRGDLSSTQRLVECASRYRDLMVEHFEREENIVFRLVEDVMDEVAKTSLAASMKGAELQLGANGVKKYEQIAETLEETWAL